MNWRRLSACVVLPFILTLSLLTGCSRSYTLTTNVNPPQSGIVYPSTGQYKQDQVVSISAKAENGMSFDHWSGDVSGTSSAIDVTMNSNKNVNAIFKPIYNFDVYINPPGTGSVSAFNNTYKEGSTIKLVAMPESGFVFDTWSGDISGSTDSADILVDSNKKITANFKLAVTLKIDITPPSSGTVTPSTTHYKEGDKITLTANPAQGYDFVNWDGDVTKTNPIIDLIMDSDKHLTAIFKDVVPPANVTKLTALPAQGKVILSWQEPADTDFANVEISYEGTNTLLKIPKGTIFADITGLIGQKKYTFTVKAVDTTGNKSGGVRIDATPQGISSLDYFKIADGYGINYQVKDSYDGLICRIWAVSQYNKTRLDKQYNFVFSLTKDGTSGGYYRNSLIAGFLSRSEGDIQLTAWQLGNPVGNQAHFYFMFTLPRYFNIGDQWYWAERHFTVEKIESQTINGITFTDCIKVSVNAPSDNSAYLTGEGYYILTKDVGIIQLVYNRVDGTKVTYDFLSSQQFDQTACNNFLSLINIR